MMALIILYGIATTPIMYLAAGWFSVPATAYVTMVVANITIGLTTTLATFVLDFFSFVPSLVHTNDALKSIFLLFPQFCLGRSVLDVARNEYTYQYEYIDALLVEDDPPAFISPWSWHVAGRGISLLTVHSFAWAGLLLVSTHSKSIATYFRSRLLSHRQPLSVAADDGAALLDPSDDVELVESGVSVQNLQIVYRKNVVCRSTSGTRAVRGISFSAQPGQCFGLLGLNGAGKSSTFNAIVGEQLPTKGSITINGHDVVSQPIKASSSLGYCPQECALIDRLTVLETLQLYAQLRGISTDRASLCLQMAKFVQLDGQLDRQCQHLSGGNRRRLSFAVAVLGPQSVICLDEPSAAVDVTGQLFLWQCIAALKAVNKTVILTSHSMQECEACCDVMAIMTDGEIRQQGSLEVCCTLALCTIAALILL
jgi:ABC-type multidrug transport system ATPase subunit